MDNRKAVQKRFLERVKHGHPKIMAQGQRPQVGMGMHTRMGLARRAQHSGIGKIVFDVQGDNDWPLAWECTDSTHTS